MLFRSHDGISNAVDESEGVAGNVGVDGFSYSDGGFADDGVRDDCLCDDYLSMTSML